VQYSSQGVREETSALASKAISDTGSVLSDASFDELNDIQSLPAVGPFRPEPIEETTEPHTPVESFRPSSSSALTEMIKNSPPDQENDEDGSVPKTSSEPTIHVTDSTGFPYDERTSLLRKRSVSPARRDYRTVDDIEGQDFLKKSGTGKLGQILERGRAARRNLSDPRTWDRRTIWRNGVVYPVSLLPAVLLGLLLNILDALSYGMILFPLGNAVFANLGADGISIFYVSTIIAQLVFSFGGSIFKGGVGSEMIEVVPFFHKMAFIILNKVGAENSKSVIATTILSYAVSSVLTGSVFFLMGACKLGSLIGFFPRHILIGCIGGVGWFLIVTGVEVSARLPGNLEYDLATLRQLLRMDTLFLWTIPLFIAIGLIVLKRWIKSNSLVGTYFLGVGAFFYIVKFASGIPLDTLRENGWVFEAPSASNPWYHFYTLYGKPPFSYVRYWHAIHTKPEKTFRLSIGRLWLIQFLQCSHLRSSAYCMFLSMYQR
jgi:SulP family sulfate permease